MIHIDFDPANLTGDDKKWWEDWQKEATKATKEVIDAWEVWRNNKNDKTYDNIFNKKRITEVWTELKNWLLKNVFNDKCAYCETKSDRATLQAEHYRPKGRVTSDKDRVKVIDDSGQSYDHPGYFWLAFHWKNLLPTCEWCNTVNGKRNEFPIQKTTYLSVYKNYDGKLKERFIQSSTWPDIFYFQPTDLDEKEGRWLLHPYLDHPEKSLRFDAFGKVISIGKGDDKTRGDKSIEAYNLNQEKIVKARNKAQRDAFIRFSRFTQDFLDREPISPAEAKQKAKNDLIKYIQDHQEPYTAAIFDYLKRAEKETFK